MGQKAFGARCFGPNSLWRKPVCGRRQPFYGRQPRPKPLVQIVLGRTCHCAETLRLWSIAWKGACGPNCLGPNSMRRKPLCFLMLLPIDKIRIATPLNLHIPQQSMGTGYGPKSVWRKMLRPELVVKACLWQTAAILWQTAETKTLGSNCLGPNLSLRRDVAALEHSMERRLRPKLPRPELDETKAAVLFDASPYRQYKNCYTFESTHSAAVNGNRVWAKKLLAQDASARTRWDESLSVADGSHSMADSRDQNLWFKLFWAEPVTAQRRCGSGA